MGMDKILAAFLAGVGVTMLLLGLLLPPKYNNIIDKQSKTLETCLNQRREITATSLELINVLGTLTNLANSCVHSLWTTPFDSLQELRREPEPEPLPKVDYGALSHSSNL